MRPGRSAGRRAIGAALAVVGLLFAPHPVAFAQGTSGEIKVQIENAANEIERLEELALKLDADLDEAKMEVEELAKEIVISEVRVNELERKLGVVQAAVSDLALDTFVSGDQIGGIGGLLTDSGSVTEAVEREQYAKIALSAGVTATDDLDATINDLTKERQVLAGKQQRQTDLIEVITARQAKTEKASQDLVDYKAAMKVKLGQALEEEQRRRDEAAAREFQAQQAAARARNAAASGGGGGGGNAGGGGAGTPRSGGTPGGSAGETSDGGTSGGGGGGRSVPPPSPGAGGAVAAAMSQLGVPYKYATSKPGVSFDCSGLTAWAWGQAGVSLPHQSRAQYASITHIDPSEAQPGDLIFNYNPISHVGIYIGNGQMIHAPNTGDVVKIGSVRWHKVSGVGRPG